MSTTLLPIPRHQTESGRTLTVPAVWRVYAPTEDAVRVLRVLTMFREDVEWTEAATAAEAQLCLEPDAVPSPRADWYTLDAADGRITVRFEAFRGGRNAMATLTQLLTATADGFTLPEIHIEDDADNPWRGVMFDMVRAYIPPEVMRDRILMMAMNKMSILHLHLLDAEGYAMESPAYPRLLPPPGGRAYSFDEMRAFVEYAASLGIDCVPELDVPGHARMLTAVYPDLVQCETGDERTTTWVVCLGKESTYELIETLIDEVVAVFPFPYVHIGTDEIQMRDNTEGTVPSWDSCPLCQELSRREGLQTDTDRFYYFVRRMHAKLASVGRRTILWNDNIDISVSPDLPRDLLIEFWRIAEVNRGPVEGCSLQRFLDEGFEVINAYFPELYIDLDDYSSEQSFETWTMTKNPPVTAHAERMCGAEISAWGEFSPHYEWTFASGMALFAARVWNAAPARYDGTYRVALTRNLCGDGAAVDVFSALGGIVLPRSRDGHRGYPEKTAVDAREALPAFAGVTPRNSAMRRNHVEYTRCLLWMRERQGQNEREAALAAQKTKAE